MAFSFDDLYELLRTEKYAIDLQELKTEDLSKIKSYFESKQVMLNKQQPGSEFYDLSLKDKTITEIQNARRALKDLYEKRERKIINRALFTARTDFKVKDTTNMLATEVNFYEFLLQVLRSGLTTFFQEFNNVEASIIESAGKEDLSAPWQNKESNQSEPVQSNSDPSQLNKPVLTHGIEDSDESVMIKGPDQPEETPKNEVSADESEPIKDESTNSEVTAPTEESTHSRITEAESAEGFTTISVLFKEDTDELYDPEGNSYGPFKQGDKAELPYKLVNILIEQNLVEELAQTPSSPSILSNE